MFKPFRYNVTVQWSDRHQAYVGFVGALLSSARMFSPESNLIQVGNSAPEALIMALEAANEFLACLNDLGIIPPHEEITTKTVTVDSERTVNCASSRQHAAYG